MPSKQLKILFIAHSEQMAGAERVLLELIRDLRKKKVVCKVIIPAEGLFSAELKKESINYKVIPYSWWVSIKEEQSDEILVKHLLNLESVPHIIDEINSFKPDMVYSNTMVVPWGAIAAFFTGTKHIWGIHEFGEADHRLIFQFGYRFTLRLINLLSDYVFANAKSIQKNLELEIDKDKISQFYYHIKIDKEKIKQITPKLFSNENILKLIIIGSVTETKGQFEAVKAVNTLAKRKVPVELVVIGPLSSQSYYSSIEKYIRTNKLENSVHLHSYTSQPLAAINQADVLLLCSQNEAFARVVLEGMLLKKPVIGTNSGGTPEQIIEGKNGFLYQRGNISQLADKIEKFVNNKARITKMGEVAYDYVTKHFTEEKYFGSIFKRLLEIKSNSKKPNPTDPNMELLLSLFVNNQIYSKLLKFKNTNSDLELRIERLEHDLHTIQNAKFYKFWQKYTRLKKMIIKGYEKK